MVEHDRRPELDVGGEHAIGLARLELRQRGLLERLGDLEALGADLARGAAQDRGARVLGAVDAVAEAHQALALVERLLDPLLGVAGLLDLVEHLQHARGRAAVQRPRQRADRGAQRRRDVRAGGGDHARRERRGVHAVLGGGDPVGVDRLDVVRVGLAAPADQEPLGDRGAPGRRRAGARAGGPEPRADCATKESAITDARASWSRATSSEMSISGSKPHSGAEHRQRRLHVDARVAGADGERVRLGGRQARLEPAVDEQAPHLLERHLADEVLDVDPAVAQRAALLVGLGDLGGEGDDAFQAGLDFTHGRFLSLGVGDAAACDGGGPSRRCRTGCIEHHRRREAGRTVVEAGGAGGRRADAQRSRSAGVPSMRGGVERHRHRGAARRIAAVALAEPRRSVGPGGELRAARGRARASRRWSRAAPGRERRGRDRGAHAGVDRLAQLARRPQDGRCARRAGAVEQPGARTSHSASVARRTSGTRRCGASAPAAC